MTRLRRCGLRVHSRNLEFCTRPRELAKRQRGSRIHCLSGVQWWTASDAARTRLLSLLVLRCYPQTFHVFEQMGKSVIHSLLKCQAAENCIQTSSVSHRKIRAQHLSSIVMRDSLTRRAVARTYACARASQAQLNTTLCSETGMEGQPIVLSSRWNSQTTQLPSVRSAEATQLTTTVMQHLSFINRQHVTIFQTTPCVTISPSKHSSQPSGSSHASQSSSSPTWMRHANAFVCPSPRRSGICLSNDDRRSDVRPFVPMSAQFNNVSTGTTWNSFLRYASCIHNSWIDKCRTFPDPVLVHIPRAALLSDAMATSSCIPICSLICEVCFDVATALTMP